jgi:hypothetical protein
MNLEGTRHHTPIYLMKLVLRVDPDRGRDIDGHGKIMSGKIMGGNPQIDFFRHDFAPHDFALLPRPRLLIHHAPESVLSVNPYRGPYINRHARIMLGKIMAGNPRIKAIHHDFASHDFAFPSLTLFEGGCVPLRQAQFAGFEQAAHDFPAARLWQARLEFDLLRRDGGPEFLPAKSD